MTNGAAHGDPGWRKAVRRFLPYALVPMVLAAKVRRGDEPRVLGLRVAFLAFGGSLFGFLAVLSVLFPVTSTGTTDSVVYALVGAGLLTLLAIPWVRRRITGSCGEPPELAEAYASSTFLGVALVESAALFGFVAAFLAEAVWPYLAGMLVALVGLAGLAPTSGRIRDLDESLSTRGCHHSLREGLFASDAGDGDR